MIVGSVDGNRIWGKDLEVPLAKVEWSADSRHVLFATVSGKCTVYSADGEYVKDLALSPALPRTAASPDSFTTGTGNLSSSSSSNNNNNNNDNGFESDVSSLAHGVVSLEWYKGVPDAEPSSAIDGEPSLAVGMSSGWVQMMMHAIDENMIVFDSGLIIRQVLLSFLLVLSSAASGFVDGVVLCGFCLVEKRIVMVECQGTN